MCAWLRVWLHSASKNPKLRSDVLARVAAHVAQHGQRGALTAASKATGVSLPTVRQWVRREPPAGYRVGSSAKTKRGARTRARRTETLRALLKVAERLETARARVTALEAEYAALRAKL